MDTYKGESPAKKLMRIDYWLSVWRELGEKKFLTGKHLVLASREGGDVSALLAFDVPAKNILAVDINERAVEQARRKFPQVRFECIDVFRLPSKYRRGFVSAYLDFCSPTNTDLIKKVALFSKKHMRDGGVLGMTFLMGREKDGAWKEQLQECDYANAAAIILNIPYVRDNLTERGWQRVEQLWAHGGARRVVEEMRLPDHALPKILKDLYKVEGAPFQRRCEALAIELGSRSAFTHKQFLFPAREFCYRSETARSRGVPMYCVSFRVHAISGRPTLQKIGRACRANWERGVESFRYRTATEAYLRSEVLWSEEQLGVHRTAGLYNISPGTLVAWKAHKTMGTYEGERPFGELACPRPDKEEGDLGICREPLGMPLWDEDQLEVAV